MGEENIIALAFFPWDFWVGFLLVFSLRVCFGLG